jgi:nucleoid-associated protein YgaU
MHLSLSKWTALAVLGVTFVFGSVAGFTLRGKDGRTPPLAAPADLPPPIEGGVDVPLPPSGPRTAAPARASSSAVAATPTPGAWYRLAAGDTLSQVSQRAYGTARRADDIARANPALDPRRLAKGTLVYVPKGTEAAGAPPGAGRTASTSPRSGTGR